MSSDLEVLAWNARERGKCGGQVRRLGREELLPGNAMKLFNGALEIT